MTSRQEELCPTLRLNHPNYKASEIRNHTQQVRLDTQHAPTGALALLQVGRALAMQSDRAKARDAYQIFLTVWKDAAPDIPVLKQAKAEYAKLQ